MRAVALGVLLALIGPLCGPPLEAQEGHVSSTVPEDPSPSVRYVIYLHGRIIETSGRRPTHPQFGIYEYDDVLAALSRHGFHVVSEHRPPETEVGAYARKVAEDVRSLLEAGVPPSHIGVVGFSKGGLIAIATSAGMQEPINYVFLAACSPVVLDDARVRVSGRVLSVFEETDEIGVSCGPLLERSPSVGQSEEVRISTGLRHGAFYAPREEWMSPVVRWLDEEAGTRR